MLLNARRGAFIVFEGIDRTGKSTQATLLAERLRREGHRVKLMHFPERGTRIGKVLHAYLSRKLDKSPAAVLDLFSANRWEHWQQMMDDLSNGVTLICDRYAYAGVAYTHSNGQLSLDRCKAPDRLLPRPDAILYMTMNIDKTSQRGGFGGEIYEVPEVQRRVMKSYEILREGDDWITIEADGSIDEVHERIVSSLQHVQVSDSLEHRLWGDEVFSLDFKPIAIEETEDANIVLIRNDNNNHHIRLERYLISDEFV